MALGLRGCSAMAKAAPQQGAAARPAVRVRQYVPHQDHPAVADICRNVYGGKDWLPHLINEQAAEQRTQIVVAEDKQGRVDGLVCCQQRGDALWVWGLRTRQEARGRGLGALLLEHVEAQAAGLPGAAWLLSTTIPANATMVRMFARLGYQHQCELDIWPSREVKEAARQLLSQHEQQGPHCGGSSVPPVLSCLPAGVESALRGTPGAAELLPRWEVCSSTTQLEPLHLILRRARTAGGAEAGGSAAGLVSATYAWLPLDYKLLPFGEGREQQAIQDGHIWLLHTPGAAGYAAAVGLLLISYSRHHHLWFAGIVAGSEAVLASAVLKALEVQPRCLQFYVDRCGGFAPPAFLTASDAAEAAAAAGEASFLVYHKRLQQ